MRIGVHFNLDSGIYSHEIDFQFESKNSSIHNTFASYGEKTCTLTA